MMLRLLRVLLGTSLCLAAAAAGCTNCELQLVQIVFRHGDRSPVRRIESLEHLDEGVNPWPAGLGQLTSRGEAQHFKLGQLFKNHYIEDLGLTSQEYDRFHVFINSTDVDRTLMSAASQLASWFPTDPWESPYTKEDGTKIPWKPIPVHTTPKNVDYYIAEHQNDGVCPALKTSYEMHPLRPEWQAKLNDAAPTDVCQKLLNTDNCNNAEAIKELGSTRRLNISDLTLENIWKAADTLFVRHQWDLPVPDYVVDGSDTSVLDWVVEIAAWQMYEMYDGTLERRLSGGNLVKRMLEGIHDKFRNGQLDEDNERLPSTRRLVLYSAHDTTIAALLKALDANHFGRKQAPPYASAVIMELWTDSSGSQSSGEVRLYFESIFEGQKDNTDVNLTLTPLSIQGCTVHCPLEKFERILEPVIPTDWFAECGLAQSSTGWLTLSQNESYAAGFAILLTVLILIGVVMGARWYIRRRRLHNFAALAPGARFRISESDDESE